MRWLFRWLFRLLILLVVLVVAAILLLDTITREILQSRIQRETGLETRIGRMRVGLLDPHLTIEHLVIYNSAEFGGSPLVDMPELHIECDRSPLFHANFHFKLIRLNLARLNVVEDAKGRKNLDLLDQQLAKNGDVTFLPKKNKGTNTHDFPRIDTLNLTLGRATYLNLNNPAKVTELKFDIQNQVYTSVQSEAQLQNILLVVLFSRQNLLGADGQYWMELLGGPRIK